MFEAMAGTPRIYISDNDILEESNLNRLPFRTKHIGHRKTEVLQRWIREHIFGIRRDCDVICLPALNEDNISVISEVDVVYDCTDRLDVQKMISKFCRERKIKYYHPGYNGSHITITTNTEEVWGEGNGYTITPSFVAPTVIVAALCVHASHSLGGKEFDLNADIGDILLMTTDADEEGDDVDDTGECEPEPESSAEAEAREQPTVSTGIRRNAGEIQGFFGVNERTAELLREQIYGSAGTDDTTTTSTATNYIQLTNTADNSTR